MALMDMLIELDVSRLNFSNKLVAKKLIMHLCVITYQVSHRWRLDGMTFCEMTLVKEYFRWSLRMWMKLQIMTRKMIMRYGPYDAQNWPISFIC